MKTWKVIAELNMNASHWITFIVTANTERNARKHAEAKLKKDGAHLFHIISIKEITR